MLRLDEVDINKFYILDGKLIKFVGAKSPGASRGWVDVRFEGGINNTTVYAMFEYVATGNIGSVECTYLPNIMAHVVYNTKVAKPKSMLRFVNKIQERSVEIRNKIHTLNKELESLSEALINLTDEM